MKKLTLFLALAIFGTTMCFAQDVITKQNGDDIKTKVIEVGTNEVKYKKFDNLDGPIYSISVSEILMIRYENGTNEVFTKKDQQPTTTVTQASVSLTYPMTNHVTPNGIVPNMRYKEYKDLYQPSTYVRHYTDPYHPAVSGVCSFLIPGLGQMICGEVGRGFGYLGGVAACYVAVGVGAGMAYYAPGAGLTLATLGSLGAVAVSVCAIVDGVRVAKIKNMYTRDIRNMSAFNIELQPYVDYLTVGNSIVTPVGLSLVVSF